MRRPEVRMSKPKDMRNEILRNVAQSNKEMKNIGKKVRRRKERESLNLAKERRENRVGAIFKEN